MQSALRLALRLAWSFEARWVRYILSLCEHAPPEAESLPKKPSRTNLLITFRYQPPRPGPMRGLCAQTLLKNITPWQQHLPTLRRSLHVCRRVAAGSLRASSSPATASPDAEPPRNSNVELVQHDVPEGIAEPMSEEMVVTEQQRRRKLWFAAIKPPMYTVSIVPVLVSVNIRFLCFQALQFFSAGFI